jgi:nickel-dependent lactate racemase
LVECWLPYGRTEVHVSVPLRNLIGMVEPKETQMDTSPRQIITESLQNPVGSPSLEEIMRRRRKIVVGLDGTLQPTLASSALSSILEVLQPRDIKGEDVTVVIGNGLRERSSPDLLNALQGPQLFQDIRIVEHSRGTGNLRTIGKTSKGTEVEINRAFLEATTRVAVGEVRLDPFTGMRGAHNLILPALSGASSIEKSRRLSFKSDTSPEVMAENPVYEDGLEAAKMAEIELSVNLVTDGMGDLLSVHSGELEKSWEGAVAEVGESHRVETEGNADVVVVSAGGSRFDYDLYNSIWALRNAVTVARRGATIILMAECPEGLGADGLDTLSQVEALPELRRRYMLGAKAVHLIKTLGKQKDLVLVSTIPAYLAEPLGLTVERTANEALSRAYERRRGRRTLVVTHGCTTIPYAV